MYKAKHSRVDIAKSSKVKGMFVCWTNKRFNENRNVNDIQEHGHPWTARTPLLVQSTQENLRRDPHQVFSQKSWRGAKGPNGTMSSIHHNDLNISPCKNKSNRCYLTALWRNNNLDAKSFLRAVWQAPSWTLYSEQTERSDFVWNWRQMHAVIQRQAAASYIVWTTVTTTVNKPLDLWNKSLNQTEKIS